MVKVVQHIPMTLLVALGAGALKQSACNAASFELRAEAALPTQQFANPSEGECDTTAGLAWMSFAKAALADGRPMLDWERQDADEFFWSQFA